jgi:hypothetical protein
VDSSGACRRAVWLLSARLGIDELPLELTGMLVTLLINEPANENAGIDQSATTAVTQQVKFLVCARDALHALLDAL